MYNEANTFGQFYYIGYLKYTNIQMRCRKIFYIEDSKTRLCFIHIAFS